MADHIFKMSEVPKGQRFCQFMDYYKYRVIVTVCVILALVPLVYQNVFMPKPDVTILAATQTEIAPETWAKVTEALSGIVPDENGDGETLASVETVFASSEFQNKNGEYHMAYQTKLIALLKDAPCALQIIDDSMVEYFTVQGCLATFGELPDALGHDEKEHILIPLKESKLFRDMAELPDNLFLTMRPREAIGRGKHQNDADYYDKQIALFYAIVA